MLRPIPWRRPGRAAALTSEFQPIGRNSPMIATASAIAATISATRANCAAR